MQEIWKPIPGYPGYEITREGLVCGPRGVLLPINNPKARQKCYINLRKSNRHDGMPLGRLLLLTFVGPPPKGKNQARHLDDDQENNNLDNLAWGSPADNQRDAERNGRKGKGTPQALKLSIATKRVWDEKRRSSY